jgi:NAD dependent epimerase/dehydratase family enzyme
LFAVENMDVSGPLNACAPQPVRNGEFTKTLASVLRRPSFLRLPARLLHLAGDIAGELLPSKRVVPAAAIAEQFGFQFPELRPALDDLFS